MKMQAKLPCGSTIRMAPRDRDYSDQIHIHVIRQGDQMIEIDLDPKNIEAIIKFFERMLKKAKEKKA